MKRVAQECEELGFPALLLTFSADVVVTIGRNVNKESHQKTI